MKSRTATLLKARVTSMIVITAASTAFQAARVSYQRKYSKTRKSKKGTGDAPAKGNEKEGKGSGKKEAKGGKSWDAKEDGKERAIITADRKQCRQETIVLCNEGVLNEQRTAVSLLHASVSIRIALTRYLGDDSEKPSLEEDDRFKHLR